MLAGILLALAAVAGPAAAAPATPRALPPKPPGAPQGAFRVTIHPNGDKTKCLTPFASGANNQVLQVIPCDPNNQASYWFVMYGPTFIQSAVYPRCLSLGQYKTGTTGFVPPKIGDAGNTLECPSTWPQQGPWSNDPLPTKWNLHDGLLDLDNLGQFCYSLDPSGMTGVAHACDANATKWTYQEWW